MCVHFMCVTVQIYTVYMCILNAYVCYVCAVCICVHVCICILHVCSVVQPVLLYVLHEQDICYMGKLRAVYMSCVCMCCAPHLCTRTAYVHVLHVCAICVLCMYVLRTHISCVCTKYTCAFFVL